MGMKGLVFYVHNNLKSSFLVWSEIIRQVHHFLKYFNILEVRAGCTGEKRIYFPQTQTSYNKK